MPLYARSRTTSVLPEKTAYFSAENSSTQKRVWLYTVKTVSSGNIYVRFQFNTEDSFYINVGDPTHSDYAYQSRGRWKLQIRNVQRIRDRFPALVAKAYDLAVNSEVEFPNLDADIVGHTSYTSSQTMLDTPTKGYQARSDDGEIINNPCYLERAIFQSPELDVDTYGASSTFTIIGHSEIAYYDIIKTLNGPKCYMPGSLVSDLSERLNFPFMDSQSAINSSYGNIDVSDIQALVNLGEGRKTISHLYETGLRLLVIYKAIKTGDWGKFAPKTRRKFKRGVYLNRARSGNPSNRKLKDKLYRERAFLDLTSEAWLEARYAWRPLVIDARNILKLVDGQDSLSPRQTFRGFDDSGDSGSLDFLHEDDTGRTFAVTADYTVTQVVNAGVLCEASRKLLLGDQVGSTNFLGAAVDLIPFSFILQWFINIQGLLYYMKPQGTYNILSSWDTVTQEITCTGSVTHTSSDGSTESKYFQLTKTRRIRNVGAPSTYFAFDVNLDFSKLLDLTFIMRNLLSKRGKSPYIG